MAKSLELTGQKFGKLTVLKKCSPNQKPKDKNGNPKPRTWWFCQCECGNITIVQSQSLTSGNTKSCGCTRIDNAKKLKGMQDLVGKRFGKLLVIKKDIPSQSSFGNTWQCQCDCGNISHPTTSALNNGNTTSCGCMFKKPIKDITGQKFGKLTVLSLEGKRNDDFYYWKCKCDCGNIIFIRGNNLKTGNSQSCGCEKSRGERFIKNLLTDLNYNFQQEYIFPDLLSNKGVPLRFDFCLIDKKHNLSIIEVNGTQHFKTNNRMYSKERVEYDIRKRLYCKQHNIPLLDLNYNKDDTIPEEEWIKKVKSFGGEHYSDQY